MQRHIQNRHEPRPIYYELLWTTWLYVSVWVVWPVQSRAPWMTCHSMASYTDCFGDQLLGGLFLDHSYLSLLRGPSHLDFSVTHSIWGCVRRFPYSHSLYFSALPLHIHQSLMKHQLMGNVELFLNAFCCFSVSRTSFSYFVNSELLQASH